MWEWRRSRKLGFLRLRATARPARRAGLIVRLHDFARSGPTKEAHRRAIYSLGGLQRSAAAGSHRSPTPRGTHQGRG